MIRQLKTGTRYTTRVEQSFDSYLVQINRYKILPLEEETDLIYRSRRGDNSAREKLINCNLRFVVSVAKQYQNIGLPMADIVQAGNIGLMKAVDRFDPTRGFKFISYAVWWIRQSIIAEVSDKSRLIRIPMNYVNLNGRIQEINAKLIQTRGYKASREELQDELGVTESILIGLEANKKPISKDSCISPDTDTTYEEMMGGGIPIDSDLSKESLAIAFDEIFHSLIKKGVLKRRDVEIIKRVFGIGMPEKSLDEIGMEFHLTRERVRQTRENVLKILRQNPDSKKILVEFR